MQCGTSAEPLMVLGYRQSVSLQNWSLMISVIPNSDMHQTSEPRRSLADGLHSPFFSTQLVLHSSSALAVGFTKELKKQTPSLDDYSVSEHFLFRSNLHEGVKFFDVRAGSGNVLDVDMVAVLHYTCRYRGLTAVSSREARTLGGNRTIAEPLMFRYGTLPSEYGAALVRKSVIGIGAEVRMDPELRQLCVVSTVYNGPAARAGIRVGDIITSIDGNSNLENISITEIGALLKGTAQTDVVLEVKKGGLSSISNDVDIIVLTREATAIPPAKRATELNGGGGLFSGAGTPKVPPIVYVPEALAGLRVGGQRNIIVPADVGYGDEGEGEIPPGASFLLEVELLDARRAA
mmetsp:Transcript_7986/g.29185  ORF Transcript_7986/g.29185 Transcript_7986/m.29185 type:complete len:348 (-) Transcript_7986:845-1888(-)